MFYFLTRRVSVSVIFAWSAVVLLCTTPGVQATPIEARIAKALDIDTRGCGPYGCKDAVHPGLADPTMAVSPDPAGCRVDGCKVVASSVPSADAPDVTSAPAEPTGDASQTPQTGGAFGRHSNFSPLLVGTMATISGAFFVLI